MDGLKKHIEQRLKTKKSCTVFESDLKRVWPVDSKSTDLRIKEIKKFAKENNYSAVIWNPGIRVTFRKLNAD